MKKDLVVVQNGEPVTDSLTVAEGLGIQHRALIQLIKKYEARFVRKGKGTFTFQMLKSGGRPTPVAYLNEENAWFLTTLIRNSDISVEFKDELSSAFMQMKRALIDVYNNRQNAEWVEQRKAGIIQRKEQTDIIKEFVEYAMGQGSKQALFYYGNITRMQNQALFFLSQKYPNLREVIDRQQLITVSAADQIVLKALRDGMAEGLPYKEIFFLAKKAVLAFADLVGKSPIPKVKELT